ncbi:tetraspanin-8 [Nothoprocta perdicaria]|uniref:tetraspanin-8 n=1 Tax=Nothoprocta perdicaria TaxID=30464 RepID=UPI000E1BFE51|nr:tetraspanin-8 [Nothoprocta perdicaria]
MAGVNRCIKYSMFIFNFLFWVFGCVVLGVGIWIRVRSNQEDVQVQVAFAGIDLLIAVGCIIMVLGFLGCCGAIKESQCMLLMFFIGLLLILILQIVTGILAAVYKPQIATAFSSIISANVDLLQSSSEEGKVYQENFQIFQNEYQCCGLLNGPEDWGKNFNVPINNQKVCECAVEKQSTDLCTYYRDRYIYKTYCGNKLISMIEENMIIIMGLTFGVAVIEVLALAFSMSLYCQIKRK